MPDTPAPTVDPAEIEKFTRISASWWDAEGDFKPLHRMNPIRLDFIRESACAQFGRNPRAMGPLDGLRVADVGCGGGLLCEPLARMGASVVGVDPAEEAIAVAREHAASMGLEIDYRAVTAGTLAEEGAAFDVVLAMEIVEHVPDIAEFVASAAGLVAPGGLMIVSTLNRTARSYGLAIVAAEHLLRWLPRGTHDWNRFPTPEELGDAIVAAGLAVVDDTGFSYDLLRDRWSRGRDLSVNYALVAERGTGQG